ncbi:MAG: lysophospholipase L2 [candidate division BRC1 bacterium ADurb.BinA364]|nr:MAG: lysophospholipase L2 [candidate division BRC1 bacterium ADurb.BinA364]
MRTSRSPANLAVLLLCAACLGGCVRSGASPPAEPAESPFSLMQPQPYRQFLEYEGADGARLGCFYYPPLADSNDVALIYLHGIESHSGWFDEPARALAARGYAVYSLDRRGSGINRENRGFRSGDIADYETPISDVEAFARQVAIGQSRRVLIGLSWGGKLAMACALRRVEHFDALVLITPGLKARVDLPLWSKARLFAALAANPLQRFGIPIETAMFTPDPVWQERIERDSLRLRQATARFFWESVQLDRWIEKNVRLNDLPILLFLAGRDRIVDNEAIIALLGRGGQESLTIYNYRNRTHSIQFEAPEQLVKDIDNWIQGANSPRPWERGDAKEQGDESERKTDRADHTQVGPSIRESHAGPRESATRQAPVASGE